MKLSILYRGPLSSCNYGCDYCPFAKHTETDEEHTVDAAALERFASWVSGQATHQISVLFTPWGEALVRRRYQLTLARLTRLPNVEKIAIQTNLSCRLDWTEDCDKTKLGLWATYHPTQVTREQFLAKCREAERRGLRFSVGAVGMKDHLEDIEALRRELPPHIYLWVNAYKRVADYYTPEELAHYTQVDPLFPLNTQRHASLGRACRAGASVVSVDGEGTLRRCHFIKTPLGNIYASGWEASLQERACTNAACGCHIGYVHLDHLKLYEVFGEGTRGGGILERIPRRPFAPASEPDQLPGAS